jgi:hypothetical protein
MSLPDHNAIPRWPLEWPAGWKRASVRQRANFSTKRSVDGRLSVIQSTTRLEGEVERLGGSNPVLSTNVSLRLDGRPRSDEEPRDPGAALYFNFKGRATVLACDKWNRVADNIAAIAAHIDALRRVDRYGVGTIEQALAGYKALPADTAADWRAVLGVPAEFARWSRGQQLDVVNKLFYELAKQRHPDRANDDGSAMAHLNRARDYALAELGG